MHVRLTRLHGIMVPTTNIPIFNFFRNDYPPSLKSVHKEWLTPILHRPFSNRERRFEVPPGKLETNFVRSSGAGGQNVNKVNTKVELRFDLDKADWMDDGTKERLGDMYDKHVNKHNEFIVTSQATRSQQGNLDDALKKLQRMVDRASKPPKQRQFKAGLSEHTKEKRKEHKRHRSEVKQQRKGKGIDD